MGSCECFEEWFCKFPCDSGRKVTWRTCKPIYNFVLNNPPGHTSFCDYFHSSMKIVCLPPQHNSTLRPVDLGDCGLFLAYYQGRIIYLGSKWDRGWRWYALEFWKMCNSYYALKNIAASFNEMKETNFLKGIWKHLWPEFTQL